MGADWGVIIVAAGRGTRMGTKESKQYLQLADKPILVHTLELFQSMETVKEAVLVVGSDDVERCRSLGAAVWNYEGNGCRCRGQRTPAFRILRTARADDRLGDGA